MWTIFGTVLVSAGIPTAVLGFLFSRLNHRMDKTDAHRKEQEAAKLKSDTMLIKLVMASLSLGEATAEAVQRIPDAHCNGDMAAALDFAKSVKTNYRDFEHEQTVKAVNGK